MVTRIGIKFMIAGAGMKEMVKSVMDRDTPIPVHVLYPPAMVGTALEQTVAGPRIPR